VPASEAVAAGPAHVHDVAHGGGGPATSTHAYSPLLMAMTYYTATGYGLTARQTVAAGGPEGARGRGGVALAALTEGAALVDIRPLEQRAAEGEVPGAVIIGCNVLEWRLDPRSEARIPALARADTQIIVMCAEGYSFTLAAVTLRRIGLREAADLDGGFHAWKAAGLPTRPAQPPG
jgi:rhodanese-related sulfurtransferase